MNWTSLFGTLGLLVAFSFNPCHGEGNPVPAPLFVSGQNIYHTYQSLSIGDGNGWCFFCERWSENSEGVISPPDKRNLHSRTFWIKQSFRDLVAEFKFIGSYREVGSGGAGLIFRAQDGNHFYAVYFPWGGQQLRAAHFWASVVKVEGDGYSRSLKSA